MGGSRYQAIIEHLVRPSADILVTGVRIAGPILAVTIITDVVIVPRQSCAADPPSDSGNAAKLLVGFGCLSFYFLPTP